VIEAPQCATPRKPDPWWPKMSCSSRVCGPTTPSPDQGVGWGNLAPGLEKPDRGPGWAAVDAGGAPAHQAPITRARWPQGERAEFTLPSSHPLAEGPSPPANTRPCPVAPAGGHPASSAQARGRPGLMLGGWLHDRRCCDFQRPPARGSQPGTLRPLVPELSDDDEHPVLKPGPSASQSAVSLARSIILAQLPSRAARSRRRSGQTPPHRSAQQPTPDRPLSMLESRRAAELFSSFWSPLWTSAATGRPDRASAPIGLEDSRSGGSHRRVWTPTCGLDCFLPHAPAGGWSPCKQSPHRQACSHLPCAVLYRGRHESAYATDSPNNQAWLPCSYGNSTLAGGRP